MSSDGISDTVVTHIGSVHGGSSVDITNTVRSIGQMKISPTSSIAVNISQLALVIGNQSVILEIFNFNRLTGEISGSNSFLVNSNQSSTFGYGIEFSPDNTKLYYSGDDSFSVYQFDLLAGDNNAVRLSKTNISGLVGAMGLQLGPDGKIYVAHSYGQHISVITDPNSLGSQCNFVDSGISLPQEMKNHYTFPSFIAGYQYHNGLEDCGVGIEENLNKESFVLYPNPSSGIITIDLKQNSFGMNVLSFITIISDYQN